MGKPLTDLDPDGLTERHDDRWTLDKLARAGFERHREGRCQTCHQEITWFRKDAGYQNRWLVLDAYTLEPHGRH